MQRTTPPATTTSSSSVSQLAADLQSLKNAKVIDSSPQQQRVSAFLDTRSPSNSNNSTEPKTPATAAKLHPNSRSPSVLPTPPSSLNRLQQQQVPVAATTAITDDLKPSLGPSSPGLTFSPMSDSISSPSQYSNSQRTDLSRVHVIDEDSSLLYNDTHISDSFLHQATASPFVSQNRAKSLPLDSEPSFHLKSETSSLMSSSNDSAFATPSSAGTGSATSRSPSLSFRLGESLDQSHEGVRSVHGSPNVRLPEANCASMLSSAAALANSPFQNPLMTTNVYINGLPPHFPEQELHELCKGFGPMVSVKTFTRNSSPPSGYGFVLFETLQGAEECVKNLRQYRNLHPSFAKRTHRIPGTALEAPLFMPAQETYPAPVTASPLSPFVDTHESFNAKMERLTDHSSSNLYVEGLPQNTDANLLDALVAPHRIRSSRIFPSKLAHPPRMIAFVRLESRDAAIDTIDRLNGRAVRDWNGNEGDKLLVKFADSAMQRDLRKIERMAREQRDQLRMASQNSTPALATSPFQMGLAAAAPISPTPSMIPNLGLGMPGLTQNLSGAAASQNTSTITDLERTFELLRLQSLAQQQTQVPAQTSISALLAAQQQLQAQNQAANLFDIQSRTLASTVSPTMTHTIPRPFEGGVDSALQSYTSLQNVNSNTSAIDFSNLRSLQSRIDTLPSYSQNVRPLQKPFDLDFGQKNLGLSSLLLGNVQQQKPIGTSAAQKSPTMHRYVPPPAREADHSYARTLQSEGPFRN